MCHLPFIWRMRYDLIHHLLYISLIQHFRPSYKLQLPADIFIRHICRIPCRFSGHCRCSKAFSSGRINPVTHMDPLFIKTLFLQLQIIQGIPVTAYRFLFLFVPVVQLKCHPVKNPTPLIPRWDIFPEVLYFLIKTFQERNPQYT